MRKLSVFGVLFAVGMASIAQKGNVTTATNCLVLKDFKCAQSNIDGAMVDEKSFEWPKTWYVAAEIYLKLDNAGIDSLGGIKAVDFYKKAMSFDEKGDAKGKGVGKYKKEISISFAQSSVDLVNLGIVAFQKENYTKAALLFSHYLDLSSNTYLVEKPSVDTAIVYNAALASYNAKDWPQSVKYFTMSIDLKYKAGDPILLLNNVYVETKDTLNQISNLKQGFELYPEDDRILTELINLYIQLKRNNEAIVYLDAAIKQTPSNASFHYAKGVLYGQTDKFDLAVSCYNEALRLDPQNFNSLYNLGVLYFNKGVDKTNSSNDIKDLKLYEVAKAEANTYFEKSLPFMEKASLVKPTDKEVLISLKNLYYRFNQMDKYNATDAKIKSLQ